MNIEFVEDGHKYLLNGVILPSVSDIMKSVATDFYKFINETILENAKKRGTAIHKATEDIDLGQDYHLDKKWFGYIDSYVSFKKEYKPEIIDIEKILTNGEFCGTIDRVCIINGVIWLLDIKTSKKINYDLVAIQLAGYKTLAESMQMKIDKYGVVHLSDSDYEFEEIIPNEQKFNELLEIYRKENENV